SPTPTSGIALPLTTRQTQYLPFCSASDLCQCRRGDRVDGEMRLGATSSIDPCRFRRTDVTEYSVACRSLGLCPAELDYFAPLLGIVSDELAEVGDRAVKYHAPKVGKPRLQLGISEPRIDLAIELINDLGRRVFGRTEANPLARLETRHEIA